MTMTSPSRRTTTTTTTTTTTLGLSSSSSFDVTQLLDTTVAMASFSATMKLLCSIAVGAWMSRQRLNNKNNDTVLDGPAISALSRLTYWLFQPAFLLCSVTKTFALAASASSSSTIPGSTLSSAQLALMPLVAMFQCGMGALTGQVMTTTRQGKKKENNQDRGNVVVNDEEGGGTPASDPQRSIVRMCTTFGNSGPLPLLFADALFARTANNAIQSQVVACISFYLLAWSPLFWSFGKVILGTSSSEESKVIGQQNKTLAAKLSQQFKLFLSPPVIGSIMGIIIGATPHLRQVFLTGWAYPFFSALQTLGTAYLPAALLVLAGSLASKKKTTDAAQSGLSFKSIGTISLARFILAPCWALLFLLGLDRLRLLGEAASPARAILTFVILMEGCMPPAQNSVILLQLVGLTGAAASMAQTLTVLYALAVLPVTLLMSACLSISGISNFL